MKPVVEVENLKKHFPLQRGLLARSIAMVKAVDGVSFAINPAETLCLVGESGCGKSTVGKVLLRLSAFRLSFPAGSASALVLPAHWR
jgi:peptide/nickel transport system ATP-binding protein